MGDDSNINIEIEQALFGSLLNDPRLFDRVDSLIEAADFSERLHEHLYEIIKQRADAGETVDVAMVRAALGSHEAQPLLSGQGMTIGEYVARLHAAATTTWGAIDYARELRRLANVRRLKWLGADIQNWVDANRPVSEIVTAATDALDAIGAASITRKTTRISIGDAAMEALADMQDAMQRGDGVAGISTGLRELDKLMGGLQPGQLIVVGGRPGMGKTALALSLALSIGGAGGGVLFFSLEMPSKQLAVRAIADHAERMGGRPAAYEAMSRGDVDQAAAEVAIDAQRSLTAVPVVIDDQAGITMSQVASRCKREAAARQRDGGALALIVIDHTNIVAASSRYRGNRTNEVGEISAAAKVLAKDLGVPVLLLSQLNRSLEARENKRPTMADLRDSGSIEQDADVVLFPFREEYYVNQAIAAGDEEAAMRLGAVRNVLELNVAKNRQGQCGTVRAYCDISRNIIRDLERRYGG